MLTVAQAVILNRLNTNAVVLDQMISAARDAAIMADEDSPYRLIEFAQAIAQYKAIRRELMLVAKFLEIPLDEVNEALKPDASYHVQGK